MARSPHKPTAPKGPVRRWRSAACAFVVLMRGAVLDPALRAI